MGEAQDGGQRTTRALLGPAAAPTDRSGWPVRPFSGPHPRCPTPSVNAPRPVDRVPRRTADSAWAPVTQGSRWHYGGFVRTPSVTGSAPVPNDVVGGTAFVVAEARPWLEGAARRYPYSYALVDVETSGLDPAKDRIVQIAVAHVSSHGVLQRTWSTLLGPGLRSGAGEDPWTDTRTPRGRSSIPVGDGRAGTATQ